MVKLRIMTYRTRFRECLFFSVAVAAFLQK